MSTNSAAWLDGVGQRLRVGPAEMPAIERDQLLIRVHAAAVNGADWKAQDTGMFIEQWPTTLGLDAAGEVVEVGTQVKDFKKGDRVTTYVVTRGVRDAYQLFIVADTAATARIPEGISYAEGSVIPTAFHTAAVALSSEYGQGLGLPLPSLDSTSTGKTIVVWGGSSSVGAMSIQLATAAGVKVVATASKHNFELCTKAGAVQVIDRSSSTVLQDVIDAVKATEADFAGAIDAASTEESSRVMDKLVERLGGGLIVVLVPDLPEPTASKVKRNAIIGVGPLPYPLWRSFVTPALDKGVLKILPPSKVVGKGLQSVQKGLDENKAGVSGVKLVIDLSP